MNKLYSQYKYDHDKKKIKNILHIKIHMYKNKQNKTKDIKLQTGINHIYSM